jgi:hypothetical protein
MAFAVRAHDKEQETHGKHFAMRFSRKRTAKSTRHLFARQTAFAVRFLSKRMAILYRALMLTHGKLILEHIKKSPCA